jgi:hypothetical protein
MRKVLVDACGGDGLRLMPESALGAMSSPVSVTLASLNRALCGAEGPTAGCRRCEIANNAPRSHIDGTWIKEGIGGDQ